jgi:hypothetical protein
MIPTPNMKYLAKNINELTYKELMNLSEAIHASEPVSLQDVCECLLEWSGHTICMYEKAELLKKQGQEK